MEKGSSPARPNNTRRPDTHTLHIDGLAAGGHGVAKLESGQVVFVPDTCPGDVISARVDTRSRTARGTLLRVLEPSASRKEPECPLFTRCGGCDWMHILPSAQQAAHADIVQNALFQACAKQALPPIRVHPAPQALAYRTRARFFASAHGKRKVQMGYRSAGTHELVPVSHCAVLDPSLSTLLAQLPAMLEGASGQGDISVARGAHQKPCVEIHWQGLLPAALWSHIDRNVGEQKWAGARVWLKDAKQPASFGDPRALCEGADGLPLWIAPGGFAQASDQGARTLAERVNALASRHPERAPGSENEGPHILELFSGSGTLSVLLARRAASFTGVELDAEATACARENFALRGLGAKHIAADANAFGIPPRAEIIVLDPPRTGALGAARSIAESHARVVVYAACDPATLARDIALLHGAGFMPTHIETLELFPQTSHVETIVRLAKGQRPKKQNDG